MSMFWIAALALAATPDGSAVSPASTPASPASPTASVASLRSGRELAEAARAALRRWARPSEKDAETAAREFLSLYGELQQDTQLPTKEREALRHKVRGRLAQLATQISRRIAKEARLAKLGPASVDLPKREGLLAQWGGGMIPQQPGLGGPQNGGTFGVADAGDQLVELIQRTISPQSWDVNGGPGAIYYWRPQRAMVISAPDDVHDQINDLLDQMNRLNR